MPAPKSSVPGARGKSARNGSKHTSADSRRPPVPLPDSVAGLAEQLIDRLVKPFDLVLLTRDKLQETLDEAAERGRITRADANDLVTELVRRGRQQTDQLVRTADRARRSVGSGAASPIAGYDDLTASQVTKRLEGLKPVELRKLRDYEARHANRKSVLDAVGRALR